MKLYIFRHGQTDGNVRNIVQGAGVDIELNETGRRQAERLAAELKGEGLDVIYASPMKRADETARIVAAAAGVPVIPMPGLEEVHFGEAEGMLSDEAKDKYKDVFSIIHDTSDPNWMDVRVPGGESVRDSLTRGQKVLERIAAEGRAHGWHKIGVATHGALMFNLYQAMFGEEHKFENCECFIIEIYKSPRIILRGR